MLNTHRIILAALITLGLSSAACARPTEKITITIDKTVDHVIDSAKPSRKPGKAIQAPSGDMDAHFIKADEYFASTRPLRTSGASDVVIARMITAPSEQTKDEAQFMDSYKGAEFWTKNYWKTRIATPEDLKIGTIILHKGLSGAHHTYFTPRDQKDARNYPWKLTKITDTSDLFKGEVTVAGNKKVKVDAIRVIE
ncbi:MAG: hypothetical protein OEL57_09425 [Trichlorobacter sp.]|uniref:hypothetical protein n=1 Tax=Trichlorobacter sp. TaxID=2911007 RepID=UPI002565723C|nr:hypothetical protein [Trichlorobacter sp.]MDK9718111.1 hypothetical protein [Trichlorobacter sp.]